MTDFENFKEKLPSKEKFYSSLAGKKIGDKEYGHVLNLWDRFETKTMKDYHDVYLKCAVLLSADVSESFRNNSFNNYGLCPSHYLSAPGLSWDAILEITKIKLELITYPHMYIFFGKGTRGGSSYISNRYNKTNNKYLKSYDPKQESKPVIYLDAINLHGYAITTFLNF